MEVQNMNNIFKKNKYIFLYYQDYGNPQQDKMGLVFFNNKDHSEYDNLYKVLKTNWTKIYDRHKYMVTNNRVNSRNLLPWYTMREYENLLDEFFGAGNIRYPIIELIGLYPFKQLPVSEQMFEFCPNDITTHITSFFGTEDCLNMGAVNKKWLRKTRSNEFVLKMKHLYFYKQGKRAHRKIGGELKEYQLFWYAMIIPRFQNMFEAWETFLYEKDQLLKCTRQNHCMWYEDDDDYEMEYY